MTETGLRILVIDDEQAIRRFLRTALSVHGHTIYEAANGETGLAAILQHRPDVIFLDLGLPDMDGIEIIHQLREWSSIPIIVLSVRDQEQTKIEALDAGADDYLTKPFSMGELMARMRVALRHALPQEPEPVFRSGNLTVNLGKRLVTVDGEEVQLTPTEYDLLRVMVLDAGKVLTHRHLLRQVWGGNYMDETHLLRVNISNLRHKIEMEPSRPKYILTEPGVGYRLRDEP